MEYIKLGNYIRDLRETKGYSLKEFCLMVKCDYTEMIEFEVSGIFPEFITWVRIKRLLSITDEEIENILLENDDVLSLENRKRFKNRKVLHYKLQLNELAGITLNNSRKLYKELGNLLKEIEKTDNKGEYSNDNN